jgi:hypothetical protein
VANVLTELFARVGHLLYRAAASVPPAADVRLNGDHRIGERLGLWDAKPAAAEARRIGNAAVAIGQEGFVDPVDFLLFVCHELKAGRPAADLVPSMLRGKAHGDLHGRNVLVGLVGDRAHWPALFDYEHMRRDNLVGWDFAKLETELKIRAYPLVYADLKPWDFAHRVVRFETALDEATEQHRRAGGWPAPAGKTAEERLLTLLLALRRLAGTHLGEEHGRADHWLEELYFLLGCYGVNTGKYDNQKPLERLGAFLSAGVALARFEYSRKPRLGV